MHRELWTTLIRRIPVKYHDHLILVMVTGTEIMVTRFIRLEEDFLIFRGRLAGTTDDGRIIMIPYHQINNIAFNRPLLESELQQIFGEIETFAAAATIPVAQPAGIAEVPKPMTPATNGASASASAVPAPAPAPLPAAPAAAPAENKPAPPSKSVLLARLRARLKQ